MIFSVFDESGNSCTIIALQDGDFFWWALENSVEINCTYYGDLDDGVNLATIPLDNFLNVDFPVMDEEDLAMELQNFFG